MILMAWLESLGPEGQVLLLTLFILVWYTVETHRVANAAVAQVEATHKPFVVPVPIPEYLDELEDLNEEKLEKITLRLRNIGTGPAINVHCQVYPTAEAAAPLDGGPFLRPLAAGEEFDTAFPVRELCDPASFKARYESLGGKTYESFVKILERKHLKDFRFAKL